MTNIALILSGGAGLRAGTEIPKQYIEAGGRPVISYCIETFGGDRLHTDRSGAGVVSLYRKGASS